MLGASDLVFLPPGFELSFIWVTLCVFFFPWVLDVFEMDNHLWLSEITNFLAIFISGILFCAYVSGSTLEIWGIFIH